MDQHPSSAKQRQEAAALSAAPAQWGTFQQQSASACFIPDSALRRLLHKAELESINASVL